LEELFGMKLIYINHKKTETDEIAERFILGQKKVGVFPTLTPKLPAKRDFIGVRKHLLPFKAKDRFLDDILKDSERPGFLLSQDDFANKSIRITEGGKDGIEHTSMRKKRLNSSMANEDQAKIKAQMLLEEKMKALEEKYTKYSEHSLSTLGPKETKLSPKGSDQNLRENTKSSIDENPKKRTPGLSVDSIESRGKMRMRGLKNILKLIK